jgi:uncharacterized protein (TIGR02270 family)
MAAIGAGASGDREHVPWLIDIMATPQLARVAAEAYAFITGANWQGGEQGHPPADFRTGPNEDPKDANVALDPDDGLPWPDVQKVKSHWSKIEGTLLPGRRYFLGGPISADRLHATLRDGWQRQRAAAAMELALLTPGQPLFDVKAPAFRQVRALAR